MGRLAGRTAVVTGASRGIGRAIAERLAADGADVAVHYGRNESSANETVARIEKAGGRAFAVRAELGTAGDVDALFAGLERGLAGRPLDILVNNAAATPGGPIETDTPEQFDQLFAVNVSPFSLPTMAGGSPVRCSTPVVASTSAFGVDLYGEVGQDVVDRQLIFPRMVTMIDGSGRS